MDFQGFSNRLVEANNCFLIDWFTVSFKGADVGFIKWLIGLDGADIPWEEVTKFRNGYPAHYIWNGITISYGADDPQFYKDPSKVRYDMGVCLNFSGTGCRTFESYGHGDWMRIFRFIFRDPYGGDFSNLYYRECKKIIPNITRLDIAYDDHTGILNMQRLLIDVAERNFRAKAKYTERTISDDISKDLHGTSLYFGSDSSPVLIRIYDKAAERGFKPSEKHWIRVEMQLRDERAKVFGAMFVDQQHLGRVASGVLRNYLQFVVPSDDPNKARWKVTDYWNQFLLGMEKISLWITPGEPYNFAKTEYWLAKQYGQAIRVLDLMYGSDYLIKKCRQMYPEKDLSFRYQQVLETYRLEKEKVEKAYIDYAYANGLVDQLILDGYDER